VISASGVRLALTNPLNQVSANLDCPGTVTPDADGQGAVVALSGKGAARLTLTYQRRKASGVYEDVYNIVHTPEGAQRQEPVSVTVKLG
jgi:shikimate kinase